MKKELGLGFIGTGVTAIAVGVGLVLKGRTKNKTKVAEEASLETVSETKANDCDDSKWYYDEKAEAKKLEEKYLQALAEAEETRKKREKTQTEIKEEVKEEVEVSTEDLLEAEIRVFCKNNKQYEALLVSKEFTRFKNLLMERRAILEKNECSGISEVYRITNELLDIVSSL